MIPYLPKGEEGLGSIAINSLTFVHRANFAKGAESALLMNPLNAGKPIEKGDFKKVKSSLYHLFIKFKK